MKDLINEAMIRITSGNTVENIIEAQLIKTIEDIIRDQLRPYSEFGKILKEKINAELAINLSNITFAEYNKITINLIEGIVNNAVTEQTQGQFKADILKLFGAPPAKIKLSEIIEKYIEESDDEFSRDNAENIALIIKPKEYGSVSVSMNPKDTQAGYAAKDKPIDSWQQCEFYMSIKIDKDQKDRGKLSWTNDRTGLKPHQFMPTCLHGVSRLLYQMYCAGSIVIFDEGFDAENYETCY